MEISFNSSPCASLGIEVELGLVDVATGELVSAASPLLDELQQHDPSAAAKAKHELFECTVEVITGVCATAGEARGDLDATISAVRARAADRGLSLIGAGTHPFSHWRDQRVSPDPRYHQLVEHIQWPARRLAIHGVHYHVGVPSGEVAVAVTNSLAFHLPLLLVLSASSPYWHGFDTGLASCRTKIFESLPTAGLPPQLTGWTDFERFMSTFIASKAIKSVREVWWDIRPHPTFGTVELRMCDAMASLGEVVSIGALAQCLVHDLTQRSISGSELPGARDWVIRQNKWLAARFGLEADLIVDDRGTLQPARAVVDDLLQRLEPIASELGCADEIRQIDTIFDVGPGYRRQRTIVERGGSMLDVVNHLVNELEAGTPLL